MRDGKVLNTPIALVITPGELVLGRKPLVVHQRTGLAAPAQRIDRERARTPFQGIGKPEHSLAGFWSRRITGEPRSIYEVTGKRRR